MTEKETEQQSEKKKEDFSSSLLISTQRKSQTGRKNFFRLFSSSAFGSCEKTKGSRQSCLLSVFLTEFDKKKVSFFFSHQER